MTEIIEQMKFCNALEKRLTAAVITHENRRNTINTPYHGNLASYNGIAESGATKTQIQDAIVRLRRELNILSSMFDRWEGASNGKC